MSFPIQKTLPKKGNKYYNTKSAGGYSECIKGVPTQSGLNVLDNCVGWACGRFNEVYSYLSGYKGMKYPTLNCNAEYFIKRGKTVGLKSQTLPITGGIMVWEGKGSKAGHVEFVEKRNSKTSVYTSASGYKSYAFANRTRTKGNGNWGMGSSYKYIGCLIDPYMTKDTIDLTEELQHNLNKQFKCGLKEDGVWGKATEAACTKHYLQINNKYRTMNKWLQQRLIKLGYSCGKSGADGYFGKDTKNALTKYQKEHKECGKVDGICGAKTYKSLVE